MDDKPGPSQPSSSSSSHPPSSSSSQPSRFNFTCFIFPSDRLKAAMKTLKEVVETQEDDDLFTAIIVNGAGIQFAVVNDDQVLAFFTLLPKSDMLSFNCNNFMVCKFDCSDFSDNLQRHVRAKSHISIFKTQGKNRLLCYYGRAKKPRSFKVPLFEMDQALKYNVKGLEPLCTVFIRPFQWRNGVLYHLRTRDETDTKEMAFKISWDRIKFFTGEDMEEDKSITYRDQEDCDIKIGDETILHEYTVNLPLVVEKPLTTASRLNNFGVMRLYFTKTAMVTLSFEQDPRKAHQVTHGSMVFVYYPSLFSDRS